VLPKTPSALLRLTEGQAKSGLSRDALTGDVTQAPRTVDGVSTGSRRRAVEEHVSDIVATAISAALTGDRCVCTGSRPLRAQ